MFRLVAALCLAGIVNAQRTGFAGGGNFTFPPRPPSAMNILTARCEAADANRTTCETVSRADMDPPNGEAPELVHLPTCDFVRGRGGGRGQPAAPDSCTISSALALIERCATVNNSDTCTDRRHRNACVWEEDAGFCSVAPLNLAEYLPQMCHSFDMLPDCAGAMQGLCQHALDDTGAQVGCQVNQGTLDVMHAEQCQDWAPQSDCVVLGNQCRARGGASTMLGCCRSVMQDTGDELCMTTDNSYDGHMDCISEEDESPCMWGYRVDMCQNTGLYDACFPTIDPAASFGGRVGRGANTAGFNASAFGGAARGGRGAFNASAFGGRGGRRMQGFGGQGICSCVCRAARRTSRAPAPTSVFEPSSLRRLSGAWTSRCCSGGSCRR